MHLIAIKALAVIGAALAVIGTAVGLLWAGHHFGAQGVQAKWDAERLVAAEQTLSINRQILRGFEAAAASAQKEKQLAKTQTDKLRAAVRSGAERLSVAISSRQAGDPGAGHSEARAELVPEVAGDLVDIAIDGDDAVRDLNECIDKYNAVREGNGTQPNDH